MRQMGRWISLLDERVLEYLDSEGWASPGLISRDLGTETSRRRVRKRCMVLADAGYIEPVVENHYELTTWGGLYLAGEVNAELICPLPGPRPPDKVRPAYWAGFV